MKTVTVEQLLRRLESLPDDPRIIASGNFATPRTLLAAIDAHLPRYRLNILNAHGELPDRDGVTLETTFVGPAMRRSTRLEYTPCRLSLVPVLFHRVLPPDVVLLHTSTPRDGTVSLGLEVNVLPAAIEAAKNRSALIVVQANPRMPYTYGDAQVDLDEIDYLVEVDEPLITHEPGPTDEISELIGARIGAHIADGSTLQTGIGAVPDAVLGTLTEHRELRIWSEMFSDGVLPLVESGAFDEEVPLTASFVFGSQRLYDWIHRNRSVRLLRTERTNDPAQIARQRAMTSVNGALQVDLFAQANASRIKGRIYSGFGGSTDFIVGAMHSPGGNASMALPSWHPRANVSTIVPLIDGPVTSFQHSAIVTEHGIAWLFGSSEHGQAEALITKAAHPDVRAELTEAGRKMGIC